MWSYAIQIAKGLLSLHDKNVLHRDIKPKNVFLTGKAHVRLGDLGCAKLMKGGLARTQIGERARARHTPGAVVSCRGHAGPPIALLAMRRWTSAGCSLPTHR